MSTPWITPTVLEGSLVRLVPIEASHAEALCAAAESPETFRWYTRIPEPFTPAGFEAWIADKRATPNTTTFTILDASTAEPLGSSTYHDINHENRRLEIGSTWIAPRCRGAGFNAEMKLLMLQHAFEDRSAHRVQLKTHSQNAQSRRAIEKLGAQYEGALRDDLLMYDGSWRTSVYYSILVNEWPTVKAALLARLAN